MTKNATKYAPFEYKENELTVMRMDSTKLEFSSETFDIAFSIFSIEHFQILQHSYVLVISDFRMPELNGMELLRKMKESNKFVRTILMTAFALDDKIFKEYARREIINAFFQKPIRLNDLRNEVNAQLHAHLSGKKNSKC